MRVIDLFCGAGGATSGIQATDFAQVIACINHDPLAIRSHAANHPECQHYVEDIRLFDEKELPKCDALWMSAECTHISNAKGGKSRNADSRTLSFEVFRYAQHCEPNYIIVENLREILTWGPLIHKKNKEGEFMYEKDGSPTMTPDKDPEKLGSYYRYWVKTLKEMGYVNYSYKLLNSADFGEYTARTRYFGIFSKKGFPIRFPSPTHHKTGAMGLQKWKPVKELLDFGDLGESVFYRKKPLSENTLKRILAGLQKFVGSYILKYNSNNAKTGTNRGASLDDPCHTITTQGRLGLIQPIFFDMTYTGQKCKTIEAPAGTITTIDHHSLIQCQFIDEYHGKGRPQSIEKPLGTITTVDTFSLIQPFLLDDNFQNVGHHLNKPHPTILASQKYTHLIQLKKVAQPLQINDMDGYYMKQVKLFCIEHGINDIYQRMLRVDEMKVIQGFDKNYKLFGSLKDQKKFIGNSVVPKMAKSIIEVLYEACNDKKLVA
ncbi:hypothetical protein AD998_01800 [bacterium 336/3]|nr:hypothetical protein AD998_01800 [bacterium 336/3]